MRDLRAGPGSAPAGSRVWVAPLVLPVDPLEVPGADDGSFVVSGLAAGDGATYVLAQRAIAPGRGSETLLLARAHHGRWSSHVIAADDVTPCPASASEGDTCVVDDVRYGTEGGVLAASQRPDAWIVLPRIRERATFTWICDPDGLRDIPCFWDGALEREAALLVASADDPGSALAPVGELALAAGARLGLARARGRAVLHVGIAENDAPGSAPACRIRNVEIECECTRSDHAHPHDASRARLRARGLLCAVLPGGVELGPLACALAGCSLSHAAPDDDAGFGGGDRPGPADAAPAPVRDAGGPVRDAGPAADAGRAADAGTVGAGGIACGVATCRVGRQACRATCLEAGGSAPVCVDAPEGCEIGECPSGEESFPIVVARCDGPEDCGAGETCLVLHGSIGSYPQCRCHSGADAGCVQRCSAALCHDLADCPSWATRCAPEPSLGGLYRTCQADP